MPRRNLRVYVSAETREFQRSMRQAAQEVRKSGDNARESGRNLSVFGRSLNRLSASFTGIKNANVAANVQALNFQKTLDRIARRARFVRSRMLSLRGVVTTIFGGGVAGAAIKASADFGASLVELSRITGLTVERLQEYRRFFEEDGASSDIADRSITRLNKSLNEAQRGLATYTDAFDKLGVEILDSTGQLRSTDAVLQDIIRRVDTSNITQFTGALSNIFGQSGFQQIAPALTRSLSDFDAAAQRLRNIGIITNEQANNLKDLSQSFADLALSIKVQFASVVGENQTAFNDLIQTIVQGLPRAFTAISSSIRFIQENISGLLFALKAIIALRIGQKSLEFLQWSRNVKIAENATKALAIAGRALLRVFAIGIAIEGIQFIIRSFKQLREESELARKSFEELRDVQREAFVGLDLTGVTRALTETQNNIRQYENRIAALEPLINNHGRRGAQAFTEIKRIIQQLNIEESKRIELQTRQNELIQQQSNLRNNITPSLGIDSSGLEEVNDELERGLSLYKSTQERIETYGAAVESALRKEGLLKDNLEANNLLFTERIETLLDGTPAFVQSANKQSEALDSINSSTDEVITTFGRLVDEGKLSFEELIRLLLSLNDVIKAINSEGLRSFFDNILPGFINEIQGDTDTNAAIRQVAQGA